MFKLKSPTAADKIKKDPSEQRTALPQDNISTARITPKTKIAIQMPNLTVGNHKPRFFLIGPAL